MIRAQYTRFLGLGFAGVAFCLGMLLPQSAGATKDPSGPIFTVYATNGSTTIASGAMASKANGTDFGVCELGKAYTNTLYILNSGNTDPIAINSWTTNGPGFTVSGILSSVNNSKVAITVVYRPSAIGVNSVALVINTTVMSVFTLQPLVTGTPYTVNLKGSVPPPPDGSKWFDVSGGLCGMDSSVYASVYRGGVATVAGWFTSVGSTPCNRIAQWDGTSWTALGSGLLGDTVNTLTYDEAGNLYAGGEFTNAGTTAVSGIAKWDGAAWTALGSGLTRSGYGGRVYSMLWSTNDHCLYVGGDFTMAGGVTAQYVAKWNGASWTNVGTMTVFCPYALVFDKSNNLYAGGISDGRPSSGNTNMWNIAKWNGSTWTNLASGLPADRWDGVSALAHDGTTLYAAGNFTNAGGVAKTAMIAKWNGSAWSALGTGITGDYDPSVDALTLTTDNQLYVGGRFTLAGGVAGTASFAKWTGSVWQSAAANGGDYFDGLKSLTMMGTDVLVGGGFESPFSRLAKCVNTQLRPLSSGMNGGVAALAWDGASRLLFAAGSLTWVDGTNVNYVARWNGSDWTPLSSGASIGLSTYAQKLAWDGVRSNLYVGYGGSTAGAIQADRIAVWNPTKGWDSLPNGSQWSSNGINGTVYALTMDEVNNRLYVGGNFTTAGGIAITNMAMWNGTRWTNIGGGINGRVSDLALDKVNNHLYAVGDFTSADGSNANYVAKWNGTRWTALGSGLGGSGSAVVWDAATSNLYVCGSFTNAGGVAALNVAKWNGVSWSAVGAGFGTVALGMMDLTLDGAGHLYATGNFTTSGATAVNRIAKWDGNSWMACEAGVTDFPYALAYDSEGRLFVGGTFKTAGGKPYSYVAGLYNSYISTVTPESGSWTGGGEVVISGLLLGSGSDITNVLLSGVQATILPGQTSSQVVVRAGATLTEALGDVQVFSAAYGETARHNAFAYEEPRLRILGTNRVVVSSGDAVSVAKGTHLGLTPVGVAVTQTLSLTNNGIADLTIFNVEETDPDSQFEISGMPVTIPAGATSNITVRFNASMVGDHLVTLVISNNSPTASYSLNLSGTAYQLSANIGPYVGGNTLTITNGNFGTITNVLVGGVRATITGSGATWVTITLPTAGSTGVKNIVVQTSENGAITLTDAYTVNPAGWVPDSFYGGVPKISTMNASWLDGTNGVILAGAKASDYSGYSVSAAGDVNGDGCADFLVGAYNASSSKGETYLIYGRTNGLPALNRLSASWLDGTNGVILAGEPVYYSGYSVSSAGDVNGDGYDDILVGGYYGEGATGLIYGRTNLPPRITLNATWLNGTNGVLLSGATYFDNSGWSVSSAGDVNGDGCADFLVGAKNARGYFGETYLIYGRTNGLPALITLNATWLNGTNGVILAGAKYGDYSGYSVSAAGDVNGDGCADFLVGAYNASSSKGETYLIYGRTNGLPPLITLSTNWLDGANGVLLVGASLSDYSGSSVSAAGDVNGDGCADFLVGAYSARGFKGETYLIYGRTNGLPPLITLSTNWLNGANGVLLAGAKASDNSGYSVSAAGDVNGDGCADFLVGAHKASPSARSQAGETYLIYGQTNGLPALITLSTNWLNGANGVLLAGAKAGDWSGSSVSSAGDVNKDGFADLLLGAYKAAPSGNYQAGETYLVYGRGFYTFSPVEPSSGVCAGGYLVTIGGANLCNGSDVTSVTLCGFAATVVSQSATQIVVTAGSATGAVTGDVVIVSTTFGTTVKPNVFAYVGSAGPGSISVIGMNGAGVANGEPADAAKGTLFSASWGASVTNRLVITNDSENALMLSGLTWSGTGTNAFALAGLPASVMPYSTGVLSIVFAPSAIGEYTATVALANNSTNNNPYVINVSGTAGKANQTISFPAIPIQKTSGVVGLSATASSALPVAFAWVSGPGSVDGTNLTFTGAGMVSVVASQIGNADYNPAPAVTNVAHVYAVNIDLGPYSGGNTITITNGNFGNITNVFVGGVRAILVAHGANWVTFTLPSTGSAGAKDIVVLTSDNGAITLTGAYTVNPAGAITVGTEYVNVWTNLSSGVAGSSQRVYCLAYEGANLYAGGSFASAGGVSATNIAKWNGTAWTNLGSGMNNVSMVLKTMGTDLYAGGDFTNAGAVAGTKYIAKWNGSAWESLAGGMSSSMNALAHDGTNLYAGGSFTNAGGVAASHVAKWNGTTWTNLGSGVSGGGDMVWAMAHDGTNLYAGGSFESAGSVSATNIAKWNGSAWTNLGNGLPGIVSALARNGSNLYAGGFFTNAGGNANAKYVAMWNGTTWTNLGSGLNMSVNALAHDGTNLYAGGTFTSAGGVAVNRVAMWNGTTWTNLGSGCSSTVRALAHDGASLYAGGNIGTVGGMPSINVAKWGPMAILSGTAVTPSSGVWTGGYPVVISGVNLGNGSDITGVTLCGASASISSQTVERVWIVAGQAISAGLGDVRVFSTSFGETVKSNAFTYLAPGLQVFGTNHVAIASGSAASLASGAKFTPILPGATVTHTFSITNNGTGLMTISGYATNGTDRSCFAVTGIPATVPVGGASSFTVAYTPTAVGDFAAALVISNDSPTAAYTVNLAGSCYQCSTDLGGYSGGNSITVTNGTFGNITNVLVGGVRATITGFGATWFTITLPVTGAAGVKDIVVQTSDSGDITLTGAYTVNPAGAIFGMGGYGPPAWTNLGVGVSGNVTALLHDGTNLYAGGMFSTAGGLAAANVAKWNGTSWTNLSSGLNSYVTCLAKDGSNLYAGGTFSIAGGVAANCVAMWNGSCWTNLGAGMGNTVYALAHDGTNLYAGGSFVTAGGVSAKYVAKWNGSCWTNLGSGMTIYDNPTVNALAHDGTNLYAGGWFTTAGGGSANYVAKWDGTRWTNLNYGTSDEVSALLDDGTDL